MLIALTKLAMVFSFIVFSFFSVTDWLGYVLGWHDELIHVLELPDSIRQIPLPLLTLGSLVALIGLAGLAIAYIAIWRILADGETQDFKSLGHRLTLMAKGFIAFWLSNYLLHSGVRTLIIWATESSEQADFHWDPFGPDLIFAITAVALLAIAKMMNRAWRAEHENQHFL